jgi:hypothetical protein
MENFNKDDLKPFFDALREQSNAPVSLEEVREKVEQLGKKRKSKINIMNISIILSIAASIAIFSTHSGPERYEHATIDTTVPNKTIITTEHQQGHIDAGKDTDITPLSTGTNPIAYVAPKADNPVLRKRAVSGSIFNTPLTPNDTQRIPIMPVQENIPFGLSKEEMRSIDSSLWLSKSFKFPFPVVKLTVEELERLGIYSGGGGIFYESLKYANEPFTFYYMPGISTTTYDEPNMKYKNHFPVLLTDRYFSHIYTIPYFLSYKTPKSEIREMTKDLIPVIAYANANPKPLFYEEQIFWFKKTEEIIGQMPLRIQQDIRDNKYVWDLTKDSIPYSPQILEMEKRAADEFRKQKEEKTIAFDPGNAIYADGELRKKLNISIIGKTSLVDYHYKSVRYNHHIYVSPQTGDTSVGLDINTGDEKHIEQAQKKGKLPLFRFSHDLPFTALSIKGVGNGSAMNNYKPYQDYMLQKHALIPVIVTIPRTKTQHVYWYYPTRNFMKLLNEEQLKTAALYLDKHKNDSMILSRFYVEKNYPKAGTFNDLRRTSEPAFPFTKLEFDSLTLHKLGIVVHDKSVSYFFKADNTYIETNFSKRGTEISFDKKDHSNYASNTALIITDDLGRFPRMTLDSLQIDYADFNTLVPVYVKTNDEYTNVDKLRQSWRPDVIFWYKPDSAFLSVLPKQIAVPMASDVKMLETKSGGGSCTYFDVCKSKTPTISTYRFYPNPATHFLNIDLQTSMPTSVTVQLFDAAGKPVLEKLAFETAGNKLNTRIDISALPPGIYNLILETLNGDKIISRIVVIR